MTRMLLVHVVHLYFVVVYPQMLCEGKDHTEDVFHSQPVVALINKKAAEGGSAYR